MSSWTLMARWVFPVAGPPLEGGVVTIQGKRIAAVEPHSGRRADVDFGNAAILPGFVNAHTHLDLSALRGKIPPSSDFTGWLRAVIRHRLSATASETDAAIRAGLQECLRAGTTLIGDISAQGQSWPILASSPIRAIVFRELLGLSSQRAAQALLDARTWLAEHPAKPMCRPGLSPHAPYSVRSSLFGELNALANSVGVPLATHLAESAAEMELLARHEGPFVSFLQDLGVWDESGLAPSPEFVWQASSFGGVATLLVHANYLVLATLPAHASVVYCPRTHDAFAHLPHPFREFLTRGVRVALGTDGLSSSPDLDVLAEARFLYRKCPDLSGATLLRMLTLSGAEALGFGAETGALIPGKAAEMVILPLPDSQPPDPHELLFSSELKPVTGIWHGQQRDLQALLPA